MVSQRLTASVESALGLEECLVGKPRLHGLWSLRALSTHQSLTRPARPHAIVRWS